MNHLSNSVQLIGRLGTHIEKKTTKEGSVYISVPLATTERYKAYDGTKKQETHWHQIVAWGKTAEQMAVFLKKGYKVAIQGRLVSRNYKDKNGIMRNVTEIRVIEFMMLATPSLKSNAA